MNDKTVSRIRRHERIRKKLAGTPERPRISVFKSARHIYAQLIDDATGNTVAAASTLDNEVGCKSGNGGNISAAKMVGVLLAKRATEKGLKLAVFDRGGYPYHGRIKALADSAREGGLEF